MNVPNISYDNFHDTHDEVASRGLSRDSLNKLPFHMIVDKPNATQDGVCTICLQVVLLLYKFHFSWYSNAGVALTIIKMMVVVVTKLTYTKVYYKFCHWQDIEIGESARSLPKCHHTFHLSCVDKWLIRHGSCPVCRQDV